MPQLPAETSAEGQTGNIPTGKALKGTKCEIQLPSSSSTPQSASLLPGVEPWTSRMPPQDTRKGKPLSTAEHPPEPGVSPEASAAPTHHPSSPSWINFAGTETPDEIKHFQSLTSLGHTWILPRLQPWCKQALGLPWQPRAGLAAQWADLEQRIKKKGEKKAKLLKISIISSSISHIRAPQHPSLSQPGLQIMAEITALPCPHLMQPLIHRLFFSFYSICHNSIPTNKWNLTPHVYSNSS